MNLLRQENVKKSVDKILSYTHDPCIFSDWTYFSPLRTHLVLWCAWRHLLGDVWWWMGAGHIPSPWMYCPPLPPPGPLPCSCNATQAQLTSHIYIFRGITQGVQEAGQIAIQNQKPFNTEEILRQSSSLFPLSAFPTFLRQHGNLMLSTTPSPIKKKKPLVSTC